MLLLRTNKVRLLELKDYYNIIIKSANPNKDETNI